MTGARGGRGSASLRGFARRGAALAALGAALALSGCAKKTVAPVPPGGPESPVVEQTYPPARSTLVPYDTDVWVRFREPLDPSTVSTLNIYFKLDTRRIPIALQWDGATNRLRIVPQVGLELRRTYTIEITNRVKTTSGHSIGDPFFWQFTTNGLRRITSSVPPDGATWESPFAMLGWDSTEVAAGGVKYTVWAGADSVTVAARSGAPIGFPSRGLWIPRSRWATGQRLFWNVRALNVETGETADSPLFRFDVLPASTPIDTVSIPVTDWAAWNVSARRLYCRGTLYAGPLMNNAFYWSFAGLGNGLRLAGQDLVIALGYSENVSLYQSRILPVKSGYQPCSITQYYPEPEALEVANSVRIGTSTEYRFASDYFAAHAEAMARYGRVWGYTLQSNNYSYSFIGGASPERGVLRLFRYRIPPGVEPASGAAPFASDGAERATSPGSRLPFARPRSGTASFTRP